MANILTISTLAENTKQISKLLNESSLALGTPLAAWKTTPWDTSNWSSLPLLGSGGLSDYSVAGSLCVSGNDPYMAGSNTYIWTVPAGATLAQFQVWAPGAAATRSCCCGGHPFGMSGAYATAVIPVTPGDTYTACAAAPINCFYQNSPTQAPAANSSFVTGNGLTNFCAVGACSNMARNVCMRRMICCNDVLGASRSMCCRWQTPACTDSGGCLCNNGQDYCFSNSCASCGLIARIPDCDTTYYGTNYGINGFQGETCYDTNHYGYDTTGPNISPAHTAQTSSCCCRTWTSGSCWGSQCQACFGRLCYPGAGGFSTHLMGGNTGSTNCCGDRGRAGMVKISWSTS